MRFRWEWRTGGCCADMENMKAVERVAPEADVFSLDYEGRGVARIGGKTVFIKGALPLETVRCRIVRSKKQFDEAETVEVLKASPWRRQPDCRHFDTCGGCVLQHIEPQAQVALKQRIFEEQLARIGKVKPQEMLPPIYGLPWHYRERARLSVAVDETGRLKLGFQGKKSHDVVDIQSCLLLPPHISARLGDVRALLQAWADAGVKTDFVEFFQGSEVTVLNIGFVKRPSEKVLHRLETWFDVHLANQVKIWLMSIQVRGEAAVAHYLKHAAELDYVLPEYGIRMPYRPGDFTQVNAQTNALMVARALRLLDIQAGERVADLFCGLGNFSLPMAVAGAGEVVGIEGSAVMTQRAAENAQRNGIRKGVRFQTADLFETTEADVAEWGKFDKMLLDPPRSGAYAVVNSLHGAYLPKRIVYVSCNPASFARDAAVLVGKGYRFSSAGIMNLFAQTAHVEAIGVFDL